MAQGLIKFFEKLEEKKIHEENLGDTIRREHRLRKANKPHPENCLKSRFISHENLYQQQKPKRTYFSSEENLQIVRSRNENVDEQHVKVYDNDEEYATNSTRETRNFDQKYSSEDEKSSFEDEDPNLKSEEDSIEKGAEETEFLSESESSSEANLYEIKNENLERDFHDQQNSFEEDENVILLEYRPKINEKFFNEDYKEEIVTNPLEDIECDLLDNINKLHELKLEDSSLQMKRIEVSLMIHKAIDSLSKNCDRDELKEFYSLILDIRNNPQEQVQEMKLILVKIDNIVINLKKENSSTDQTFIRRTCQNVKNFLEQHLLKREDTALFFKSVKVSDGKNLKYQEKQGGMEELYKYYYEKSVRVIE